MDRWAAPPPGHADNGAGARLNRIGRGNSSSFGSQDFIDGRVDFFDFFAWVEGLMFLDSLRFGFFMGNLVFLIFSRAWVDPSPAAKAEADRKEAKGEAGHSLRPAPSRTAQIHPCCLILPS